MHFGAAGELVPVIPRTMPTLWTRSQRATVENRGAGLRRTAVDRPDQELQIVDDSFETACCQPALGLLVDDGLRRKVGRQHPPRGASTHHPAHGIEDLAHLIPLLPGLLTQQRQIRGDKRPVVVRRVVTLVG